MDKKDINESYIQKRLLSGWKSTHQYVMENLYVFGWESDFLLKTKSGYWYEAEIKISLSDFKADFKKKEKHQILENGFKIWKSWKYNPLTKEKIEYNKEVKTKRPNYFTYAVPWYLEEQVKPLLPKYAGLLVLDENGYVLRESVKPPKLHSEKYSDESLNLTEKFYYNWRTCRQDKMMVSKNHNDTIKYLRNKISLMEAEFKAQTGFDFSEVL